MATYFVFSDESGNYIRNFRNGRHKYFVRSAILVNSKNWIEIKSHIDELKRVVNIPLYKEFKWNYLWLIKLYQDGKLTVKQKEGLYFFKDYNINKLTEFVRKSVLLFHNYSDSKIIYTYTKNIPSTSWRWAIKIGISRLIRESTNPTEFDIYKWHLQELMQRIQMEIQYSNLAVLFFDQDKPKTEEHLRNSYHDIYINGDFIEKYQNIMDSLCFEYSHHSTGIQIADFIAGIFNGFLNDYDISHSLMKDCVIPILRKDNAGNFLGYGIREVPSNEKERELLRYKINEKLLDKKTNSEQDIPF